ncbi:hypothetical protein BDN72DRAFT_23766 [Pluteus cervinus]|uniref:Uncharacterized protein n=1 Tax=Pluteus cervinus TaxID=181527 RepID=A0ACD3BH85_9AGAR|nr:hypothetical protein BDN72DRAFT_23766 [Pluteus cervinus]
MQLQPSLPLGTSLQPSTYDRHGRTMEYLPEEDFSPPITPRTEYPISPLGVFQQSVELPAEGMWMAGGSPQYGVPLHAPVPIPSQLPCILEECTIPAIPTLGYPAMVPPSPRYQPDESPSAISYSHELSTQPAQNLPRTFPTPSEMLVQLSASRSSLDTPSTDRRAESGRIARRRAMAATLGFLPTDPDSISSHEKKRHYLECLERYVLYLQQQIELLGAKAFPIQRVNNYQGLNNRSIRTLLVHMQASSRELHQQTLDEEQRFVQLRNSVCTQGTAFNYPSLPESSSQSNQYHNC